MTLQSFLDAGGGDAGGAVFDLAAPVTMTTGQRLTNAVVNAPGLPFAIIAGVGGQTDRVLLEDVTCHGAGISLQYCFDSHLSRVRVFGAPVGVEIVRGYQVHLSGCFFRHITTAGVRIDGVGSEHSLHNVRIVCSGPTSIGVEAIQSSGLYLDFVSVSFAGEAFRLGMDSAKLVEFGVFLRCLADEGHGHGWRIGPRARSLRLTDCWASTNQGSGVFIEGASGVSLHGLRAYQNHIHGIHLVNGANLSITDCTASGNGGSAVPHLHGLVIGNVSGCRVIGNRSGPVEQFPSLQGYGLFVASPLARNLLIDNNDFSGNLTGKWLLQGTYQAGANYP